MKMTPEYLKTCPFCGGSAELSSYKEDGRTIYVINCGDFCGSNMSTDFIMSELDGKANDRERKNNIIKAWNRRVNKELTLKTSLLSIFDN